MVNFGEVRRAQLAKSNILTFTLVPWHLLRSVQMLKREREREFDAESKGKLPYLLIPSKIAIWVSEFAVKDLPLGRTL